MRDNASFDQQSVDPELVRRQKEIQEDRRRVRDMTDYDALFFGSAVWPVAKFIMTRTGAASFAQLVEVLGLDPDGLWADLGGGYGVAQRQAKLEGLVGQLALVDVDALGWNDLPLTQEERWDIKDEVGANALHAKFRPMLIQADVQHVQLPKPATLLTSVQVWQYLEDKNACLVHWYNSLREGGLLLVACHEPMEDFMHVEPWPFQTILPSFLTTLERAGVAYTYAAGPHPRIDNETVHVLAIERKPGTRLAARIRATMSWQHGEERGYVNSLYVGALPPIEVVQAE